MRNYFVLDANLFHAYSAKVSARGYKLNRNVSVTKNVFVCWTTESWIW